MIKYYIHDNATDEEEELGEKEFYESLIYNYEVAKEYGDEVEPLEKILNEFIKNKNHDEYLNDFVYIKETK